ncbi:MAG TPA: regulatory protein RecX [Longimicrobiales bacterium]|nr:regulatory protein RecX [Longimicrobiales bacterium]
MSRTITRLEPQRRNPELVNLYLDGELHGAVAFTAVDAERLHSGDTITQERLDRLLAADERWKARHAALSLLSVRARARGELRDRLRRKGFSDAAVEHALAEVDRLGFVDDAAFAESWVRDRLTLRPRGAKALVHELGRRHVAADVARAAVARVMEAQNVSDDELCSAAAGRWLQTHPVRAGEDDARRERRLAGFLARRGYRPGAIRSAVDALRSAAADRDRHSA